MVPQHRSIANNVLKLFCDSKRKKFYFYKEFSSYLCSISLSFSVTFNYNVFFCFFGWLIFRSLNCLVIMKSHFSDFVSSIDDFEFLFYSHRRTEKSKMKRKKEIDNLLRDILKTKTKNLHINRYFLLGKKRFSLTTKTWRKNEKIRKRSIKRNTEKKETIKEWEIEMMKSKKNE